MDAFTCKVATLGKRNTPAKITLSGEKQKPESAQHVIEFPGGAIEVSRTSNGEYWAHIIVNREYAIEDCEGIRGKIGEVVASRVGTSKGISTIPGGTDVYQIAVLIKAQ